MRINHNIMAMNTHQQYVVSGLNKSKSTEKLSSGLRINHARDDASGLAVSENMRALIRGLNQASRNIGDGISLVQTAEGGMQEIHNLLNRGRELLVQALSDSYDTAVDKPAIQQELDQIIAEIGDIAEQTEFNGTKLLNGPIERLAGIREVTGIAVVDEPVFPTDSLGNAIPKEATLVFNDIGINDRASHTITLNEGDTLYILMTGYSPLNQPNFWPDLNLVSPYGEEFGFDNAHDGVQPDVHLNEGGYAVDNGSDSADMVEYSGFSQPLESFLFHGVKAGGEGDWEVQIRNYSFQAFDEVTVDYYIVPAGGNPGTLGSYEYTTTEEPIYEQNSQLLVHSGANERDHIWLNIYDCRPATLGVDSISTYPRDSAEQSLKDISEAINTVSAYRADAGARQTRLEQTQQNVDNASVNLSSAESSIRDVDMAEVMTEYYTYSILSQASTAMLQQANQQPQSVLNLIG